MSDPVERLPSKRIAGKIWRLWADSALDVATISAWTGVDPETVVACLRRRRAFDRVNLTQPKAARIHRHKPVALVQYRGEWMTIVAASRRCGLSDALLYRRYKEGLRGEALFERPRPWRRGPLPALFVDYKGKRLALAEAAKRSGIPTATLYSRLQRGRVGNALFEPV